VIQLVRAREVAKALALSERSVLRLAAQGDLPHVRVGRSVRFDPAAVEAWLRGHSNGDGGGR
jgi:excisionase family DNA binding protein